MDRVPISHKVRKLRMTVTSQKLDGVGSHGVLRSIVDRVQKNPGIRKDKFLLTRVSEYDN